MEISINIAGIEFANPIILASGPMSNSRPGLLRADKMGVGGVVTKSATINPSLGNPKPHLVFGSDYIIGADGIFNRGYKAMAKDIEEAKYCGMSIPIIASVAGASLEEFIEMSTEFERKGADAIELNFVCPNRGRLVGKPQDETLGRYWSETPERSYTVIRAIKDTVNIPVWAKFPFEVVYRDPEIVIKMEEAGVDAVIATASMPRAMAIKLETGKPILGNPRGAGAVSGRAMKPLGINCILELSRLLHTDIIASGGVFSGLDVIEYLMVGARGVEVLTAIMQRISVHDMLAEIKKYVSDKRYDSYEDFRGKALNLFPKCNWISKA